VRDRLFTLDAPFTGRPTALADMGDRFAGVVWGRDDFALLLTRWFNNRRETRYAIDPSRPGQARVLLTRNYQERYNDPGIPVMRPLGNGFSAMHFTPDGRGVFMTAPGATREGELPLLSQTDLATGRSQTLWQSRMPHYEPDRRSPRPGRHQPAHRREAAPTRPICSCAGATAAIRCASPTSPIPRRSWPRRSASSSPIAAMTAWSSAACCTCRPATDRTRDGPLPVLMWAYPTEFTDAAVAGQVVDEPNRFIRPGGSSHLFLLDPGLCDPRRPKMPIIGAKRRRGQRHLCPAAGGERAGGGRRTGPQGHHHA
jgi:hypothetical protein